MFLKKVFLHLKFLIWFEKMFCPSLKKRFKLNKKRIKTFGFPLWRGSCEGEWPVPSALRRLFAHSTRTAQAPPAPAPVPAFGYSGWTPARSAAGTPQSLEAKRVPVPAPAESSGRLSEAVLWEAHPVVLVLALPHVFGCWQRKKSSKDGSRPCPYFPRADRAWESPSFLIGRWVCSSTSTSSRLCKDRDTALGKLWRFIPAKILNSYFPFFHWISKRLFSFLVKNKILVLC